MRVNVAMVALVLIVPTGWRTVDMAAQAPPSVRSVWTGVYTAEQAARGRPSYEAHCRSCHGEDLEGNAEYPAVAGMFFIKSWEAGNLRDLVNQIRATMPPREPATVTASETLDIVAYMLQVSGAPPGMAPIPADGGAQRWIEIVPKDGPSPLRNGTLVRTVGCLIRQQQDRWALARAAQPVRIRTVTPSDEEERAMALAYPPGDRTFRLLRLDMSPVAHEGSKVEVKGLLFEAAAGDALNVVSLAPLGGGCTA